MFLLFHLLFSRILLVDVSAELSHCHTDHWLQRWLMKSSSPWCSRRAASFSTFSEGLSRGCSSRASPVRNLRREEGV